MQQAINQIACEAYNGRPLLHSLSCSPLLCGSVSPWQRNVICSHLLWEKRRNHQEKQPSPSWARASAYRVLGQAGAINSKKQPSPSGRAPLHIAFLDKPRNQLKKAALSLWERGDPPRRVGEGIRNPYASPSRANFLPGKDIAIAVCHLEASPVKENSIHQKSINVNIKEEGTERFFGEASASWGARA